MFANTSLFTDSRVCTLPLPYCKELSYYGVLVGNTADTLALNGNHGDGWTINGGIAIGSTSNFNRGSVGMTVNGPIDFANPVVYNAANCNATPGTNYCGQGTLTGSTPSNANASRVNSAESQLDSILSRLTTYNSVSYTTSLSRSGVINVASANGGGTLDIFRNTSDYSTNGALTFGCGGTTCAADELVIIVLAGAGNQTFNHSINLADGLTADQVIFYLPDGNLRITPTAGSVNINGDFFLAKSGGDHLIGRNTGNADAINLSGRVFADDGALTFNNRGGGTQQDAGAIPEPQTWALLAGGIGMIVWKARSRTQAARGSDGE